MMPFLLVTRVDPQHFCSSKLAPFRIFPDHNKRTGGFGHDLGQKKPKHPKHKNQRVGFNPFCKVFVNYVIFPKIKVKNKRYLKLPARKPKRQSLAPTDPIILGFPYRWRQIGLGIGWVCDPSLSVSCQEMRLINHWFSFKRPYYILISEGGTLRGVGWLAHRQNKKKLEGTSKKHLQLFDGVNHEKISNPNENCNICKGRFLVLFSI